jgi:hypothetical protein
MVKERKLIIKKFIISPRVRASRCVPQVLNIMSGTDKKPLGYNSGRLAYLFSNIPFSADFVKHNPMYCVKIKRN